MLKEENCSKKLSHKCYTIILDRKEMPLKNFIQIRGSSLGAVWQFNCPL